MAAKRGIVAGIASERIVILFSLAKDAYDSDPELSRKYIKLIRRIGRHYKIKLSKEVKAGTCSKCNTVFMPGKSCTIRLVSGKKYKAIRCLNCGSETHVHY